MNKYNWINVKFDCYLVAGGVCGHAWIDRVCVVRAVEQS